MNPSQPTPLHGAAPHDGVLPDELLAANHRVAARRARSSRALVRARTRRRVIPSVVAISVALVGAGAADAYVNRTVAQPTTTTTTPPVASSAQDAANARSLAQVSRALKADQRALASLMAGAQRVRSGASSSPSAGASVTAPSTPAPSRQATPAPVATTTAPAPAPAPATHTTTGASSAPVG